MKKSIEFVIILLFFSLASKSQITKRNWMTGGGASFRSSKYEGGLSSTEIVTQLSGDVGYFVIDKLSIGLKPEYERNEVKENTNHQIINTYRLGPFVRYYLLPNEKYVNMFSEISYQYGITNTNQISSTTKSNKLSGLLGCAVFFNSSVALEFTLGYSSYRYSADSFANTGRVKSVIAGIGFQFHLEK